MSVVLYDVKDRIATIRLNRPERLNSFDAELRQAWADVMAKFEDDPDADVALVVGNGRAFSSGRDIKAEMAAGASLGNSPLPENVLNHHVYSKVVTKLTVVAIHGYCLGLGFHAALGQDYRIVTRDAVMEGFELPSGTFGPASLAIVQNIPWCQAIEVIFYPGKGRPTGMPLERLKEIGLINEIVEPGMHEARGLEVAKGFAALPQDLVRVTKDMMNRSRRFPSKDLDDLRWEWQRIANESPSRKAYYQSYGKK